MRSHAQKNEGFTLVETLVAISIFSISLLGLMSILASGISDTNYAKRKVEATYLTQEGIEYMRNMRDTFVLYDANSAQAGWDGFKNYLIPCNSSAGCYFNDSSLDYGSHTQPMTRLSVAACDPSTSCPHLLYSSATGKYNYAGGGTDSGFIRKIVVGQVSADEIKVTASVSWSQGSGSYNTTFSEDLFNWVQ